MNRVLGYVAIGAFIMLSSAVLLAWAAGKALNVDRRWEQ